MPFINFVIFVLKVITFPIRFAFPAKLKIDRYQIISPHLPKELENLRMVQLSDLHWDHQPLRMTQQLLDDVVDAVNALEPDLILLTGDYIQYKPEPIEVFTRVFLNRLNPKHGIYAVLGKSFLYTKLTLQ